MELLARLYRAHGSRRISRGFLQRAKSFQLLQHEFHDDVARRQIFGEVYVTRAKWTSWQNGALQSASRCFAIFDPSGRPLRDCVKWVDTNPTTSASGRRSRHDG